MAAAVGTMINMKYGRDDELESDKWGVQLAVEAAYDPRAMLDVMRILEEAGGGGGSPEMMSTHPKPANRQAYIQQVIDTVYPNGLPDGLRR
jgi:predicted Zn-dependent protease